MQSSAPPPMLTPPKYIAHLDLDCFFVSVERINDPALVGKPVAVGGTPTGRGVVMSASYEARAFGVRSAMPAGRALRLCPELVMVRGHFDNYIQYSDKLYERMREMAPVVERASIDEMYLDFTGCENLYGGDWIAFIRRLQNLVRDEFKLPCTISMASNKLVAKIAAGTVKPNGTIFVPPGEEKDFLAPLPVEAIPGVGKKTEAFLKQRGFNTVADIQASSRKASADLLGKHGLWIFNAANGQGSDHVIHDHTRKSIGNEETFGHDIADPHELEQRLFPLVEQSCSSLRARRWKARTVTLKLRYSDFKTITRAETIAPSNDDSVIFQTALRLLQNGYSKRMAVRLLGVRLSHFVEATDSATTLFAVPEKRSPMLQAVDKLREKFGDDVIHIGGV